MEEMQAHQCLSLLLCSEPVGTRSGRQAKRPRAAVSSGRTKVHPSHCDLPSCQGGAQREGPQAPLPGQNGRH